MALNIKNPEVERLASEIAQKTGETKTMAIRRALEERRTRLNLRQPATKRVDNLRRFLAREVWSQLAGQAPITKDEREEILGYGEDGL